MRGKCNASLRQYSYGRLRVSVQKRVIAALIMNSGGYRFGNALGKTHIQRVGQQVSI